ncbi:hypothetical protein BT69DRAFT_1320076 [Atractiella rhizophila]|nr:hypothetical protein BT69DRAFT_1320076 [Atractiella rhizophila]
MHHTEIQTQLDDLKKLIGEVRQKNLLQLDTVPHWRLFTTAAIILVLYVGLSIWTSSRGENSQLRHLQQNLRTLEERVNRIQMAHEDGGASVHRTSHRQQNHFNLPTKHHPTRVHSVTMDHYSQRLQAQRAWHVRRELHRPSQRGQRLHPVGYEIRRRYLGRNAHEVYTHEPRPSPYWK